MQQKEGGQGPVRKGIRERIMDCLSSGADEKNKQKILEENEEGNDKDMNQYLREMTRSQFSVVWNKYRQKKWGFGDDLPSLEELETELAAIVPSYSGFFTIGKTSFVNCAFVPLLPYERLHLRDTIEKGMVSRRSLHFRFNRQVDSVSDNLLDYLTNVDMFDHMAVGCSVYEDGKWQTIATARVIREKDQPEWAEWAAIVADPYHRNGIGTSLLYYISQVALQAGVKTLYAVVNPANAPVIHWMRKLGAKVQMRQNVNVWCFPIPLPDDWLDNQEIRCQIDNAVKGVNTIPAFVQAHIKEDIESMKNL